MSTNRRNAGRAALSLRYDHAAWLDQLLTTAARGGDLRIMMRSPIASRVQRIVGSAKERACATADGRVRPLRDSVTRRVLLDLEANGPSTINEVYARVGGNKGTVGSALWWNKQQGRVKHHGRCGQWSFVSPFAAEAPPQLKAAAR